MGVVKVIRIFKSENYYLYIRKTLPHNYTKMNNNQLCALCSATTNKNSEFEVQEIPTPNFVANLCHTKSN